MVSRRGKKKEWQLLRANLTLVEGKGFVGISKCEMRVKNWWLEAKTGIGEAWEMGG